MAELTFTANRLQWREVRAFVRELRERGYALEMSEGPGLLFRRFTLRGDSLPLKAMKDGMDAWDRGERDAA